MAVGRNSKGQFVKGHKHALGNKGGPGRPSRSVEERYLQTLRRVVSQRDWDEATQAILDLAKSGSVSAWKALANYVLGPPVQRTETLIEVKDIDTKYRNALDLVYDDGESGPADRLPS